MLHQGVLDETEVLKQAAARDDHVLLHNQGGVREVRHDSLVPYTA
jgi:hypothetical protein